MDTGTETTVATVATANTYPSRGIGKLLKIGKSAQYTILILHYILKGSQLKHLFVHQAITTLLRLIEVTAGDCIIDFI